LFSALRYGTMQIMSVRAADVMEQRVSGRLAGRLAGRVQKLNGKWAAQVVSWMDLVDLCLELDDALLAVDTPSPDELALHKAVLDLTIGCGTWLIHQLRVNAADFSASGHTLEVLESSLKMVQIFRDSSHADVPEAELESIRQRIFNAAA
jgi:hypothetical protein